MVSMQEYTVAPHTLLVAPHTLLVFSVAPHTFLDVPLTLLDVPLTLLDAPLTLLDVPRACPRDLGQFASTHRCDERWSRFGCREQVAARRRGFVAAARRGGCVAAGVCQQSCRLIF